MDRNYLKGRTGDQINAVMSAFGYNFRLILKLLKALLCKIITATWAEFTRFPVLTTGFLAFD